jgi:amidase
MRAENPPAETHAPAVANLLDAGARFVGKTHTAELAFSLDGRNEHDGTPINPAARDRVPGGSSSGSVAAVAAHLVDFALGSDTGGSVRGPASFTGLIGLRPTYGRIDIGGVMPLAPSLDTVGWFARDIDTFDRVGAILLGEDVEGPPLDRMIVGEDSFALLEGEAERIALAPAVARAGESLTQLGGVTVWPDGLDKLQTLYRTLQGYQAWRAHGAWIERRKPALNPAVATRFAAASRVTQEAYEQGRADRFEVMRRVHDILGKDRILVIPTMPGIAPRLDASEEEFESFRFRAISSLAIAGLSGCPQLSLPVATVHGCPLGLSLVGPPGRDRALIAVARAVMA